MSIHSTSPRQDIGNPHKCPSITLTVDDDVLGASQCGSFGACLLAQSARMKKGVHSLHVTVDYIKFNMPGVDPVDGQTKLMRFTYPTPEKAAAIARQFDIDGETHGDAAARVLFKKRFPDGFKFILQGERASKRPVIRRPHSKRGRTRHHTPPELLALVCRRRHHGQKRVELVLPSAN